MSRDARELTGNQARVERAAGQEHLVGADFDDAAAVDEIGRAHV